MDHFHRNDPISYLARLHEQGRLFTILFIIDVWMMVAVNTLLAQSATQDSMREFLLLGAISFFVMALTATLLEYRVFKDYWKKAGLDPRAIRRKWQERYPASCGE